MKKFYLFCSAFLFTFTAFSQDLSEGYLANDLMQRPMQELAKPAYLSAVTDPSFPSTSIRRISQAAPGNFVVPMYSTIQAWNADESLMIVYGGGAHQLLDGTDYGFIRNLDIRPDDLEAVFWHFNDPDILFYMDRNTTEFIRYNVNTQTRSVIANLGSLSGCTSGLSSGNDVQMMSWDSDVFSFRCGNSSAYYYRISTGTLTQFNINNINYTAPMPFPSGNLFYHNRSVYDTNGDFVRDLNISGGEHSCLGKLSNGDDAYFAISFAQGPNGGCLGTLVAHNATTGNCFSVTPTEDYDYSKSGTHISALAHKNSEGGWVAVSSMGYQRDGVQILDQELFIAKVDEFSGTVYRVAHHRSDEDDIDYWGEPHVSISPTGTRLLFGSDWSGTEDGISVDAYVAELKAHGEPPVEECTPGSIIPEYQLDGVLSSGENDLTVAFGTEVILSMLPDNIDLTIELPDGTIVGDNYSLGNVNPTNNGAYVLTSAEGCTTTLNLTVEEGAVEECTPESIIPEYQLDGVLSSGENDLTVAFGTEVVLSMLPDNIDLTIELPDGTIVGDNYSLGNVNPTNNGLYVLTSAEGCTTTFILTVEEEVVEECTPDQIVPEYRLNGVWSSGENELNVAFGTEVMLSMLPNDIELSIELPNGTIVGDNHILGNVSPANNGTYVLTSAEGCTTTITLTVEEEVIEECTPESIITEYRLDGVWSSGANELTVAFGTEVLLSMLPNDIDLTIELPDGTIVGDNYNLGNVSPANNGIYTLTSAEGCTTTITLTVEEEVIEECTPESIITEYRLDGVWSSGENELTVAFGTELMLSMLPNDIGLSIELPDGTIVGDNYNLGNVSPANNGIYRLTSAEGCTITLTLTVEEEVIDECTPESIITEYRLNGVWSSGLSDLTVYEGTEVMLSMLPNEIGLTIELPDGNMVGDNYNLGTVTSANNGTYILNSEEGCQTTINLTVEALEECQPDQIIPEYRINGVWSSGENELTVDEGTEIAFSMLPNNVGVSIELPNGTVVGDNFSLGALTEEDSGTYIINSSEGCQTTVELTVSPIDTTSSDPDTDSEPAEGISMIYPNPAAETLNIVLNDFENIALTTKVFSSSGRLVATKIYTQDHKEIEQLKLPILSKGLYLVILRSASKQKVHKILVK